MRTGPRTMSRLRSLPILGRRVHLAISVPHVSAPLLPGPLAASCAPPDLPITPAPAGPDPASPCTPCTPAPELDTHMQDTPETPILYTLAGIS